MTFSRPLEFKMSKEEQQCKGHYHCYLLKSLDPKHPYKTYIGYTTNPYRRIRQHNGILKAGGARRTKSGRPWTFVFIIHGFRDETSALKFEWAMQHPRRSKIFRSGLPNKSEALAKVFESRRGIKSKMQLAQILLCESIPYKDEALTLYFFDVELKSIFNSLFIQENKNYDDDDDEKNLWCEMLPSHTSCHLVKEVEDLPFHKKTREKSRNDNKCVLQEIQSLSIRQTVLQQSTKKDLCVYNDVAQVVVDMTIGNNGSIGTYQEDDSSCSDVIIDLLRTPERKMQNVVVSNINYSHEALDTDKDDVLGIDVDMSRTKCGSEHLFLSPKLHACNSMNMSTAHKAKGSFYSIESECDTNNSDQTIDLCSP